MLAERRRRLLDVARARAFREQVGRSMRAELARLQINGAVLDVQRPRVGVELGWYHDELRVGRCDRDHRAKTRLCRASQRVLLELLPLPLIGRCRSLADERAGGLFRPAEMFLPLVVGQGVLLIADGKVVHAVPVALAESDRE